MFSSPFSGTFFNDYARFTNVKSRILVFVPFLGDLFSITMTQTMSQNPACFRPLSWGLSFNHGGLPNVGNDPEFSSPFLGTFFQSSSIMKKHVASLVFVPFLGDFLSIYVETDGIRIGLVGFSSPFLGTFFQFNGIGYEGAIVVTGFRPLSWGLSFNDIGFIALIRAMLAFSSPFLGTFFQ